MDLRLCVLVLAGGCVEYDLDEDFPQWPESHPAPVQNPSRTDVMVQVTTPVVDILWLIDNSCSMEDEQSDLTTNFPNFMGYFVGSGLDYHVGVVSTDLDNPTHQGKLQPADGVTYIDVTTPDPEGTFSTMAGMGTTGSGLERGLGGIYLAIEELRDTFNVGFYRDDAAIHTIVISDEPDQTTIITQDEFINWYRGLKLQSSETTFSGIVDMVEGVSYLDVTNEVGGIAWSIQSNDWAEVLDRLGVQASGLKREYFLSQIPVPGTIVVEVHDPSGTVLPFQEFGGDPPSGDWVYSESRNSISLIEYMPESLAKVIITYDELAVAANDLY